MGPFLQACDDATCRREKFARVGVGVGVGVRHVYIPIPIPTYLGIA